jgi:hypothetical protein
MNKDVINERRGAFLRASAMFVSGAVITGRARPASASTRPGPAR